MEVILSEISQTTFGYMVFRFQISHPNCQLNTEVSQGLLCVAFDGTTFLDPKTWFNHWGVSELRMGPRGEHTFA